MNPESDHDVNKIDRLREVMYSRSIADKIRPRQRRDLSQESEALDDDWNYEDNLASLSKSTIAPRGIGVGRKMLSLFLSAAILFAVGAIGFFIYYFTFGGGVLWASSENIGILISGPAQISSGDRAQFQIAITNNNNVPLNLVELVVKYPPGARSSLDYSTDVASTTRISLGTIMSGDVIRGKTPSVILVGKAGSTAVVKVELEYHIDGSNSMFVASKDYPVTFTSSPLTVEVQGNTETIAGQPITITAIVSSNSSTPIKDALLHVALPFGFKLSSASPNLFDGSLWELGDILPNEKKTVSISGTLSGESGDNRIFRFQAGTRNSIKNKQIDNQLSQSELPVAISQPFLDIKLSINDKKDNNNIVMPGERVSVRIDWKNNLSERITNAVIVAKLSGMRIDSSQVLAHSGFFRSSDDAVFWDKTTVGDELVDIPAGGKGALSFSFLMPSGDGLGTNTNPYLSIVVNAAGNRVSENDVPEALQSSARTNVHLASDLQLIAEGLYHSNPFGSSGPMPPKAEFETTYAVVFTIRNTNSKLEDAVVTADMPPYVRWVGVYSPASEKVQFNSAQGTIVWKVGDIAPFVGINGNEPRQIAVEIGFTPSQSQIGKQPDLLKNITISATNASTTATTTKSIGSLTTNLIQVVKSSNDAIVGGDKGFSATNAIVVK